MPFYQYYCAANGETVEVCHPMGVRMNTWAGICLLAGRDPGETPGDVPVQRLISPAMPIVFRLKGLDKDAPSDRLEL